MLEHGGHLIEAANKYHIPEQQWIDLSTGINPNGWPVPTIPAECWQRLPESADGLVSAAKLYYQCENILPVAGSQAAIQTLPLLRKKSTVGVLSPAYAEHGYCWKKAGHKVIEIESDSEDIIDAHLVNLDVLIIINPNNPTAKLFSKIQLLSWHQHLSHRGGWLIVDEAFIDSNPKQSVSNQSLEGLIVLRSIGKFFGLAGIRCGFVLAKNNLLSDLKEKLGPWTVSHPSRYIAIQALRDIPWQREMQKTLSKQSERLVCLLGKQGLTVSGKTDLFVWVKSSNAIKIHHALVQTGILTRLFQHPASLRFGLPKNEPQWLILEKVLGTRTE